MKTWSIVCAILGVCQVCEAAPALKNRDPYYYPTKVGDKRVYETSVADRVIEITTEVVTKVEMKDGRLQVSTKREIAGKAIGDAGKAIGDSTVEVSHKGVVAISIGGRALPILVPLLKLPAKDGDSWDYGPNMKPTFTVVKVDEEVEVPAGKFRALRVEWEINLEMQPIGKGLKTTAWHAPGVGVVKTVTVSGGTERTQVLKSFTPGK